ncbi:MAG TPA: HEAT repeat domain-containing protein [Pyrinomonadaceae bacterium]|nr:HEAT repeat domain-containing protein [Pyrinomonadaceae bacterium]
MRPTATAALFASLLFAAVCALPDGAAHAQRRQRQQPSASQSEGGDASAARRREQPKRVVVSGSSDTAQGTRQTIKSDNPLNDYSAYRSGDRFYVVLPKSDASTVARGSSGKGFSDMQVQQRGDDVVLSYRLRSGAKPRVEQKFNRLDVVFEVPEGGQQATTEGTQQAQTRSGQQSGQPAAQAGAQGQQNNAARQQQAAAQGPNAAGNQPTPPAPAGQQPAGQPGAQQQPALAPAPDLSAVAGQTTVPGPEVRPADAQQPAPPAEGQPAAQELAQAQPPVTAPAGSATTTDPLPGTQAGTSIGAVVLNNWPIALAALLALVGIGLVIAARRSSALSAPAGGEAALDAAAGPEVLKGKDAEPATLSPGGVLATGSASAVSGNGTSVKPEAAATKEAGERAAESVPAAATNAAGAETETAIKPAAPVVAGLAGVAGSTGAAAGEEARAAGVGRKDLAPLSVAPGPDRVQAETKLLLAGEDYDRAVVGSADPMTRQMVAAELLSALAGRQPERRERARSAFAEHGYLDDLLRDVREAAAPAERAAAARSLGLAGDSATTPSLIAALEDNSVDVRRAAVESLAALNDPRAVPALEALLRREKKQKHKVNRKLVQNAIEASLLAAGEVTVAEAPAAETIGAEAPAAEAPVEAPVEAATVEARAAEAEVEAVAETGIVPVGAPADTPPAAGVEPQAATEAVSAETSEAATTSETAATGEAIATGEAAAVITPADADVIVDAAAPVEAEATVETVAPAEEATTGLAPVEAAITELAPFESAEESGGATIEALLPETEPEAAAPFVSEAAAPEVEEAALPAVESATPPAAEAATAVPLFGDEAVEDGVSFVAGEPAEAPAAPEDIEAIEAASPVAAETEMTTWDEPSTVEVESSAVEAESAAVAVDVPEAQAADGPEVPTADVPDAGEVTAETSPVVAADLSSPGLEADPQVGPEAQLEADEERAFVAPPEPEAEGPAVDEAETGIAPFMMDAPPVAPAVEAVAPAIEPATEPSAAGLNQAAEFIFDAGPEAQAEAASEEWVEFDIDDAREIETEASTVAVVPVIETSSGELLDAPAPNEEAAVSDADKGLEPSGLRGKIESAPALPTPPAASFNLRPDVGLTAAEPLVPEVVAPGAVGAAEKGIELFDADSTVPASIQQRLASPEPAERAAAVADLSRLPKDESFRQICAAFDDEAQEVRSAAARALYDHDADRAECFTRALRESEPERRRHIGAAINSSGLASEAISQLTGEGREKTYEAFSILFLMAKAGEVQPLLRAVEGHPNNEVRLAVVKLLALSGQKEILPAFRRLAVRGSLPTEVRSAVMEAIYQISSQSETTHA